MTADETNMMFPPQTRDAFLGLSLILSTRIKMNPMSFSSMDARSLNLLP